MNHRVNSFFKYFSLVFITLLVQIVLVSTSHAQIEAGQIIGKVVDPNGALVAGADVTIKSVDTGLVRSLTTNEEGIYTVTNLQPGVYEVSVQKTGFSQATQKVQITVGSRTSLNTSLSVGGIEGESVNIVASEGVEVNTQNQELSTVVSGIQLRELPTLTRNPYDFVALSGNVAVSNPDIDQNTQRGAGGFNINGLRSASTNVLLDGGENVDVFTAEVGQAVPLESVSEYRILTSNFSAEYGRASGGVINMTTRAGSNEFHGSLFEYNRISRLASNGFNNNANGIVKPNFTRNQFGYSLGGPVILPRFWAPDLGEGGPTYANGKNRLFFFSSTEFTRVRSMGNVIAVVPTTQLIGRSHPNTQAFFNAYGQLKAVPNGRVYTVQNVIDDVLTNPDGSIPSNNFTALPRSLPAFQEVVYRVNRNAGAEDPQNTYSMVHRIDWNISDKTQLYGRYALEKELFFIGTNAHSPYAGYDAGSTNFNQNALLSLTHTFSPRLISSTKLVFNRLTESQPLSERGDVPTLYMFINTGAKIGSQDLAFPGILPYNPSVGLPSGGPQNLGQVYQDLSLIRGNHTFKFGGQYIYIQNNHTFGAYQTATEILAGQGGYAQGLDNFVLGQLFRFQLARDPQGRFPGERISLPAGTPSFTRHNIYHEWAGYVNDSWRLHPRFTLNLGLRYEYYGVQKNRREELDSNFYFGSGNTLQERIRSGRVLQAVNSPVGSLWRPDRNNFAPRVGFAWDITGDGKTSLRGGYGIAYERNFGNVTYNVIQNPPFYASVQLNSGTEVDVGQNPIQVNNAGLFAGGGPSSVLLPPTSLRHVREDITNAYAHFWSAALERQVLPGTVASVEYSASAGRDLYSIEDINRVGSGLRYLGSGVLSAIGRPTTRLNGQYSAINTRGNSGYSDYDAMIVSVESSNLRSIGLQLTSTYTYSSARDNLSTTFSESSNNFNLGFLDPFNPSLDYGYADFDIRHRFAGSFNWEIPYKGRGLARQLLGGWTVSGIFTARTGTPFTVFDCTDDAITACKRLIANGSITYQGTGNARSVGTNRFSYIDLSNQSSVTFTDLSGGTEVGPFPANMTRRNAFRGPGAWNVNGGLYKTFTLGENVRLQLRGEFYNVFNHANLYVSGAETDISARNFVPARKGISGATGNPLEERRNIQLGLKLTF
jgi:hypothetical protein